MLVVEPDDPVGEPATFFSFGGYFYRGRDVGGHELEVIAVDVVKDGKPAWLVIHAMPTSLNKGKTRKKVLRRRKRKGKEGG